MSDKDLRHIENQTRPHGREKEARRPFWGMVIRYLRETLVSDLELWKRKNKAKKGRGGRLIFSYIRDTKFVWRENRDVWFDRMSEVILVLMHSD